MKVYTLERDAHPPVLSSEYARCYRVFASEECILSPCEKRLVGTGVSVRLPCDMLACVRSNPSVKHVRVHTHYILPNFAGEIRVFLENATGSTLKISKMSEVALVQSCAVHPDGVLG